MPHLSDRAVRIAVDALFDAITQSFVRGEKVEIRGFGSFKIRRYHAREGKNPRTGEQVFILARRAILFKAGKELGERIQSGGRVAGPE